MSMSKLNMALIGVAALSLGACSTPAERMSGLGPARWRAAPWRARSALSSAASRARWRGLRWRRPWASRIATGATIITTVITTRSTDPVGRKFGQPQGSGAGTPRSLDPCGLRTSTREASSPRAAGIEQLIGPFKCPACRSPMTRASVPLRGRSRCEAHSRRRTDGTPLGLPTWATSTFRQCTSPRPITPDTIKKTATM